jgi:hypothetical protein
VRPMGRIPVIARLVSTTGVQLRPATAIGGTAGHVMVCVQTSGAGGRDRTGMTSLAGQPGRGACRCAGGPVLPCHCHAFRHGSGTTAIGGRQPR